MTNVKTTQLAADVFCFRSPAFMWANFTVCEATGELNSQSDYGNASYRWNINALGFEADVRYRFKKFLAQSNPDYICDKLSYEHKHVIEKECDWVAVSNALREAILTKRRRRSLNKEEARELWEETDPDELSTHHDSGPENIFNSIGAWGTNELIELWTDTFDYDNQLPLTLSNHALMWHNKIVPALINRLKTIEYTNE